MRVIEDIRLASLSQRDERLNGTEAAGVGDAGAGQNAGLLERLASGTTPRIFQRPKHKSS
jgi:hypothetical protein